MNTLIAGALAEPNRRMSRRMRRRIERYKRNASYPYSSDRQHKRYARQIAAGQLRFMDT